MTTTPTTKEIREGWQKFSAWKRVPTSGAEASGAEFDAWLTEHDRAVAEAAWDEAIGTAVAHFDTPRMVWTSHGRVTVYDNEEHMNAALSRPKSLTDWLRSMSNPFRSVPKENE